MKKTSKIKLKKEHINSKNSIKFHYLLSAIIALFLISCSTGETEVLLTGNSLLNVSVNDYSEIYTGINEEEKTVEFLIPYNSLLKIEKVQLTLSLSINATSNIEPDRDYDLSEPLKIEVTAEDSSVRTYTLNAKKCEGGKSAVIVSDTQIDIIPLYRQEAFFKNINIVIDKAYQADVPIYYIMLTSLKGTDRWNLPPQLHFYDNGILVDKEDVVDSFQGTILHREFLLNGISEVYVVGVSSMGCVRGTCVGTYQRKYKLFLVSDAHSEPIGYRQESSIDKCNADITLYGYGELVLAEDIAF